MNSYLIKYSLNFNFRFILTKTIELEILLSEILNEYTELYYKDSFKLASNIELITIKKEIIITKMVMCIINSVQLMSKDNIIPNLNNIVEIFHEENKDLIIEAIDSLNRQKIIIVLYI